jgi:hypothetical protein
LRAAAWALVKLSPHAWQRQQVESLITLASVPTAREPQNGQVSGFVDAEAGVVPPEAGCRSCRS